MSLRNTLRKDFLVKRSFQRKFLVSILQARSLKQPMTWNACRSRIGCKSTKLPDTYIGVSTFAKRQALRVLDLL